MSTRFKVGLVALALAASLVPSGAAAAAASPHLDPSFGTAGRVSTALDLPASIWSAETVRTVAAPDSSLFVADGNQVLHYLPSGALDPAFGAGGVAPLPLPADARFLLAGVGAAPGGGVLVVGTASFPERPIPLPAEPAIPGMPLMRNEAILVRLDAQGKPDPSFGSDGVLLTTLGLPVPLDERGKAFEAPSLIVEDVAFDAQGRPTLAGNFVGAVIYCRDFNNAPIANAFLARLEPNGDPDPSFGSGGTVIDRRFSNASRLAVGPDGAPLVRGRIYGGCETRQEAFAAYDAAGAVRTGFGSDGMRPLPNGMSAFAIDGRGRVLVARWTAEVHVARKGARAERTEGGRAWISRLRSDGRRDRGFGDGARASVFIPGKRSFLSTVLAAPGGRVLAAGAIVTGDGKHRGRGYLATFGVDRNGKRLLAQRGRALRTGFGANASTFVPRAVVDPRGRLVLSSPMAASYLPGGEGIALVRYLFGPASPGA